MATNFITLISQDLSGAVTTRIASAFGLSEVQVRKVVDATIPALLGALISLVSKSARFDLFPRHEDNHSTEFWNLFGTYSWNVAACKMDGHEINVQSQRGDWWAQ